MSKIDDLPRKPRKSRSTVYDDERSQEHNTKQEVYPETWNFKNHFKKIMEPINLRTDINLKIFLFFFPKSIRYNFSIIKDIRYNFKNQSLIQS